MSNDHYVPQSLLQRFCNANDRLHVWDKWKARAFVSSTRNVASENGFYDVRTDDGVVHFEPLLCAVEDAAFAPLNRIVETKSLSCLSVSERASVAFFLAIQTLRTSAQRAMLAQMDEGIRKAFPSMNIDQTQVPPDYFYRDQEELKAESIFQLKMAKEFVPHFLAKEWCLNAPPPNATFLVSDNPVMLRNYYEPSQNRGNSGIASPGIQIYMPLSPQLILCLFCPTLLQPFREEKEALNHPIPILEAVKSGRAFVIPPESVVYCNSLQIAFSERFVFSSDGDFSLAQEMVRETPGLRKPTRIVVQ